MMGHPGVKEFLRYI